MFVFNPYILFTRAKKLSIDIQLKDRFRPLIIGDRFFLFSRTFFEGIIKSGLEEFQKKMVVYRHPTKKKRLSIDIISC